MSDNEASKPQSWSDREVLVYLLSTIEYSNAKLDFSNAPTPPGRNASGCMQKIGKLKKALKKDIESLKSGGPVSSAAAPKAPRKRKVQDGGDEETPKKRGRSKKEVEPEPENEVKEEDADEWE